MTVAPLSKSKRVAPAATPLAKGKPRGATRFVGSRPGSIGAVPRLGAAPSPRPPELQPKLKVGEPNDKFEQEADQVAKNVLRTPTSIGTIPDAAADPGSGPITPLVQRICASCAGVTGSGSPPNHEEEETIRTKPARGGGAVLSPDTVSSIETAITGGQPLPEKVRAYFETRFGHDFGDIRIHQGAAASRSARAIEANAYTFGKHIVFREGQYAPHTSGGRILLAHELTHVLQQRGSVSPMQSSRGPAEPEVSSSSVGSRGGAVGFLADQLVQVIRSHPSELASQDRDSPKWRLPRATGTEKLATTVSEQIPHSTSPLHLAQARRIGEAWGSRIADTVLNSGRHVASDAFASLPNVARGSAISEVDGPGDSDDPTLMAITGRTGCNLALGLPWLTVTNSRCTAPCTLLHESTHFWDIAPCCVRAGIAYRAAPAAGKAAVAARWGSWISANRSWFECRAYRVSQTCGTGLSTIALCWAPESVVQTLLIGAGALAGAAIGSQVVGALGAGVGAGAGLGGGPAAPVTVPAGAAAGFVSGEMLGILVGAGLGALAGAGAEALRRRCCDDVGNYRSTAAAKIAAHCGAGFTPCPF